MKINIGYKNYYIDIDDIDKMVEIVNLIISKYDKPINKKERKSIRKIYKNSLKKLSKKTSLTPDQFAMRFKHNVEQTFHGVSIGEIEDPPDEVWDMF